MAADILLLHLLPQSLREFLSPCALPSCPSPLHPQPQASATKPPRHMRGTLLHPSLHQPSSKLAAHLPTTHRSMSDSRHSFAAHCLALAHLAAPAHKAASSQC